MDISILPLFIFTISLAYLALRTVQLQPDSLLREQFRVSNRLRTPGISLFSKPSKHKATLALTFSLLTGIFTIWLWSVFGLVHLLLLFLLATGLFIEELDEPKKLRELPAVLGLVNQVLKHIQVGDDLLVALGKAAPTLPDGLVKYRVKKTLTSIEERLPPEKSLPILRGINPYLDQFVSDCLRAGWQNSPALEITLELLLRRGSQQWQATSQTRTRLDSLLPYLPSTRAFIAGSLVMGITLLLQEHQFPIGPVVTAILAAMVLRFVLVSPILRRTTLVSAVALMLLSSAFIAQPAQPTLAQALHREELLQRKEIQPVLEIQAEPSKIRGSFDLAECYVRTGFADGFVNLRSGPGMDHRILNIVPEEETLVYLGQTGNFAQGEWRQVRTGDQVGWMYAPFCQTRVEIEQTRANSTMAVPLIPASARSASLDVSYSAADCRIKTGFSEGWANLRAGPGMKFNVIATFPESTQLQILRDEGDFYATGIWHQVQAVDDTQGWIFSGLCKRGNGEH